MPVLTPDQFERLQRILTDAFDKRGIAELVRTKLGDRLDNLVDPDQPTPRIVFDLLTWIDKRDMPKLEVLLQGAIRMKPENGTLRAFCKHTVPGALKPIDSATKAQGAENQRKDGVWGLLRNKRNQQGLGWPGGGLVVAVTGLCVVVFFPPLKPPEPHSSAMPTVQANCGGVAIGGSVSGATITGGATTSSDCTGRPK